MYPDWPRSKADLVPLPPCDGPKLKAFDFKGKQAIEFLEYAGEGLHAHVFKVRIKNKIYALKLVCEGEPRAEGNFEEKGRLLTGSFSPKVPLRLRQGLYCSTRGDGLQRP